MNRASQFKAAGYLTSTVSVALLAAVSVKAASADPLLLGLLVTGAATSVVGMALRWRSHRIEQQQKRRSEAGKLP